MAISCFGKKCSVVKILFFIAVAIVLWLVWFGTASLLGKDMVETSFKQLSDQLTELGDDQDKNIKLSHGEIVIEGWGYKKQAVVHDVVIEASGKGKASFLSFKILTKSITVAFDPANSGRLVMVASDPINIYYGDNLLRSLSLSSPLIYYYLQAKSGDAQLFQHDLTLPEKIVLIEPQIENSPENSSEISKQNEGQIEKEQIFVEFEKAPILQFIFVPEQQKKSLAYDLSNVTISLKDKKKISIGGFTGNLDEGIVDSGDIIKSKKTLSVSDIVLHKGEDYTKPYIINTDSEITYNMKSESSDSVKYGVADPNIPNYNIPVDKSLVNGSVNFLLNNFEISNPDFKLHASGKFLYENGERFPSGEIGIDIDDLPKFMNSELVSMLKRSTVEDMLIKITGSSLKDQAKLSTQIKRSKDGGFYVGNATIEELMRDFISNAILSNKGLAPERLPDVQPMMRRQVPDLPSE